MEKGGAERWKVKRKGKAGRRKRLGACKEGEWKRKVAGVQEALKEAGKSVPCNSSALCVPPATCLRSGYHAYGFFQYILGFHPAFVATVSIRCEICVFHLVLYCYIVLRN
jgi:hypothetical protein